MRLTRQKGKRKLTRPCALGLPMRPRGRDNASSKRRRYDLRVLATSREGLGGFRKTVLLRKVSVGKTRCAKTSIQKAEESRQEADGDSRVPRGRAVGCEGGWERAGTWGLGQAVGCEAERTWVPSGEICGRGRRKTVFGGGGAGLFCCLCCRKRGSLQRPPPSPRSAS